MATLHSNDILHGDLTTSNVMVKPVLPSEVTFNIRPFSKLDLLSATAFECVYLIDFGLSFVSSKAEDKGVDLYVFKRALISTHPGSESLFDHFLKVYLEKVEKGPQIVAKFREVEKRGRKRECFG